jgi:hypothetical protein
MMVEDNLSDGIRFGQRSHLGSVRMQRPPLAVLWLSSFRRSREVGMGPGWSRRTPLRAMQMYLAVGTTWHESPKAERKRGL